MASRSSDNKKPTSDRPEQHKKRRCLMCGENFVSHHYGERVCHPAKVQRHGVKVRPHKRSFDLLRLNKAPASSGPLFVPVIFRISGLMHDQLRSV